MNKFFFVAGIISLLMSSYCSADVLPFRFGRSFTIYFDSTITPDSNVKFFSCETSTCADPISTDDVENNPYNYFRYSCSRDKHSCDVGTQYGLPAYVKLRLTYKNKTYESDPFAPDSTLEIGVHDGRLVLTKKSWLWKLFH